MSDSEFSLTPPKLFMSKVVVVFGIARTCRICAISQVTLEDIEDSGTLLIVKLKQTKNDVNRKFWSY
ncbi:hypothetical protein NQ318_012912 [Aromia moschata]|uniref:Uncharacterized protein n=1 Tax=Aromia moschata TaxID=1265417 RepID=A0AAV8YE38_9CUCU|nr:hypothetical protein NQ318_012912 [Aromia moschata]